MRGHGEFAVCPDSLGLPLATAGLRNPEASHERTFGDTDTLRPAPGRRVLALATLWFVGAALSGCGGRRAARFRHRDMAAAELAPPRRAPAIVFVE